MMIQSCDCEFVNFKNESTAQWTDLKFLSESTARAIYQLKYYNDHSKMLLSIDYFAHCVLLRYTNCVHDFPV